MVKKTIRKDICMSGIGIHSGEDIDLCLKPSFSGEIVFCRTDLVNFMIRPDPRNVDAKNSSCIVSGNQKVRTVEHLMASLYAFGLDSLIVEVNAEEIPIMDGSAAHFVSSIYEAGIQSLTEQKKVIKIIEPFIIEEVDSSISVSPDTAFVISYLIEFDNPAIQRQELKISVNEENFSTEIAPARTFGFLKDASNLKAQGLALGASMENTIVLDENGVINGPLRFPDEFVRHKILDLIGDLSLLGFPLIGYFKAEKAGHNLHLKVVRFLLDNPEYWTYV